MALFGRYRATRLLGQGSTAEVRLGIHEDTGEKVALKIINKSDLEDKPALRSRVCREKALMRVLNHPNVLKLYEVVETASHIVLVLEYMDGGDMFEFVSENGKLDEEVALRYFHQLIAAVRYCHECHVCHRDLKPENLLLSKDGKLAVGDFGLSSSVQPSSLLATSCGSPHYVAPEVLAGQSYRGPEADIWSCGVILFVLLTGSLPFDDDNITRLMKKAQMGRFYIPMYLSDECTNLLRRMLVVRPEARISIDEILKDPWFTSQRQPVYKGQVDLSRLRACSRQPVYDPNSEVVDLLTDIGWGSRTAIESGLQMTGETSLKQLYSIVCHNVLGEDSGMTKDNNSPLAALAGFVGGLLSNLPGGDQPKNVTDLPEKPIDDQYKVLNPVTVGR